MKYFRYIFSLMFILPQLNLSAQTDLIVNAEWFFDGDTAMGKSGILGINSPADSVTLNYSLITVPNSLGYGVHYIYIRTKSDTGQAWSQYEGRQFYIEQTIENGEYFIDNDPGVGNGTAFTFTNSGDSVLEDILNINTNGLSNGKHYFYIRTRSVDGKWSQIEQSKEFYITNAVSKMEYFFDSDPGVGNGIPLYFTNTSDSVMESIYNIPTTGLTSGNHILYFRTSDYNGHWGIIEGQSIFITNILASAEYFFDTDPGAGNGVPVTIVGPTDSNHINLDSINIGGLGYGTHFLYVRIKDSDGHWNLYEGKSFFVTKTLMKGEYFFDIDPGAGNGIEFTFSSLDSISENLVIPTDGLSPGLHFLSIRIQDSQGNWGNIESKTFYMNARITQFKYWIDTIPSFEGGTVIDIPIAQMNDSANIFSSVSIACMDTGIHYLYISTKDELNFWSFPEIDTFRVVPGSNIGLIHTVPGPGPNGTPLKLYGTGGSGSNYRYRDVTHGGNFSANNLFLIPNDSVVIFQVKDTCGNYALDTIYTPPTPTDLSQGGGNCSLVLNAYNQWVYIRDQHQKIIAAINDHHQNLDSVYVEYYSNNSGVRKELTNSYFYLDRNWRIYSKNTPTDSVELKLYFTQQEFDSLNAVDPSIDSVEQCQLTKYSGPNQNLELNDNIYSGSNNIVLYPTYGVYNGNSTSGKFAHFKVKSFSEFYIGNGNNIPLAIQLLNFEILKTQNNVELYWQTVNEKDIQRYEVERAGSNSSWSKIGEINAKNNFTNNYLFVDLNILGNTSDDRIHYRLKQIDEAGNYQYSAIKSISLSEELSSKINVWPNPVHSTLYIQPFISKVVDIYIYDVAGKLISQYSENLKDHNSIINFNTSTLAQGIYTIVVKDSTTEQSKRIMFEKF